MFSILLSIPKSTKHSNPNEVNWESVHSHFSDIFSEDFICVLKPFNGDHTQAKVYFKRKVVFAVRSAEFLINNAVPAKVIERKEEPNLPESCSRTIRLPRSFADSQLLEIRVDLEDQFKADMQAADGPAAGVTLQACHPEVLDYAEAALRKWASSQGGGAAAASGATGRSARRPLFPGAVSAAAEGAATTSSSSQSACGSSSASATAEAAEELQRLLGPYDFKLALNERCAIRVKPHDITALRCDVMVVTTSCSLSLNFGLARVAAAKAGRHAIQQLCQQHIAQSGNLKFGATHLVAAPPGSQLPARYLLFLALPNDKRLTDSIDAGQFKAVMTDVVTALLEELFRLSEDPRVRARDVAMTPLGASLPYWADLSEDFAHVLAGALWEARARTRDLRRVSVCDLQLEKLATLGRVLEALSGVQLLASQRGRQSQPAAASREFAPGSGDDEEDACEICCSGLGLSNPRVAFHCDRGRLCAACVRRLQDPGMPGDGRCPLCLERYRPATGSQPANGSMTVTTDPVSLPGHEDHATLVVSYTFGPGIQAPEHPNPGQPYRGASRVAYLPDSPEGRDIVRRLRGAFDGRAVFTVGTSATTGMENTVTWATVHHKTNTTGGTERHGYPDPTYLVRVSNELTALGY